jgi:hypothetical protein
VYKESKRTSRDEYNIEIDYKTFVKIFENMWGSERNSIFTGHDGEEQGRRSGGSN